ncbi:MAG: glycosyltransferase [Dehalococcoidia bacterium]|nr:glycosyltransferase [Dehalococcoidia bacterium]
MIFFVNLILNLIFLKRPSRKSKLPQDLPLVSVLIPARNEEENIELCLSSILRQDYPNIEVLVLDDNSQDKTAEIVRRIRENDRRVSLLRGETLPEGWAGKCFACYQLSKSARGKWLLFVDADTMSESHLIRGTMEIAINNNVSMLSGFPRQQVEGLTQKIVIPILFYFIIMSWFPLWLLHRSRKPLPTLAIGQMLLFNREAYMRIGGHEIVKSRIMEDVWFAIEMNRRGERTLSVDLSKVMTTRMYTSIGTMTEGCVKWFYSVAALSPLALVGYFLAAYIFYLAPFYWAMTMTDPLNTIVSSGQWVGWSVVIVLQVVLVLFMRVITDIYFRGSKISFIFHLLGVAFLILAVLYAVTRRAVGAGVAWKDRVYQGITRVK